jgi:hypothetical protein
VSTNPPQEQKKSDATIAATARTPASTQLSVRPGSRRCACGSQTVPAASVPAAGGPSHYSAAATGRATAAKLPGAGHDGAAALRIRHDQLGRLFHAGKPSTPAPVPPRLVVTASTNRNE